MFHFKKKLKIFKMNKKNQEEENELFFYLSYNSHFFYTKTSIFNDLISLQLNEMQHLEVD